MAAPADRVRAVKSESTGQGGSTTDRFYRPAKPKEDALDLQGVFFQAPIGDATFPSGSDDESVYITRVGNNLVFRDSTAASGSEISLVSLLTPSLTASQIANVPAGNLTSTNVQSALNELQGDIDIINSGIRVVSGYSADTGGVTALQAVRTGASDTIRPARADDWSRATAVGFAVTTAAAGQPVDYYEGGVITPIKQTPAETWSDGDRIYLSATTDGAVTKTAPSGNGKVILQVGVAKNNTQMFIKFSAPIGLSI